MGGDATPIAGGNDNDDGGGGDGIRVAVRVRPFLPHESGTSSCVEVVPHANQISIGRCLAEDPDGAGLSSSPDAGGCDGDKKTFTFDHTLPGNSPQSAVYDECVQSLIVACLEGYNATTLAYGQTGAGKTYTILGPGSASAAGADESVRKEVGIIPRALGELFERLDRRRAEECDTYDFRVRLQFLELYGEEIRDLLAAPAPAAAQHHASHSSRAGKSKGGGAIKLSIRDTGSDAEVLGATSTPVASAEEALLCLTKGMLKRVVGATAMNAESSRSHAMMTVLIEQRIKDETGGTEVRKSKYNFVDLAGSERSKRTGAKGQRLKEGIDINKGLLVLGNVISALSSSDPKKRKFVPFRDSKLTRLLRGSLGGNHKTLLIACVSPSARNLEESLNCLRYANRAKNIKNRTAKPSSGTTVCGDPALAKLLSDLRGQVGALAAELLKVRRDDADSSAKGAGCGRSRFTMDELVTLSEGFRDDGDDGKENKNDGGAGGKEKSDHKSDNGEKESSAGAKEAKENTSVESGDEAAPQHHDGDELHGLKRELVDRDAALAAVEAERDALREKLRLAEEKAAVASSEEAKNLGGETPPEKEVEEKKDETTEMERAVSSSAVSASAEALDENVLVAIVERIVAYQAQAEQSDRKRTRRRARNASSSFCETETSDEYDDDMTDADDTWAVGTVCSEATGQLLDDLAVEEEEEELQAREELIRRSMSVRKNHPLDDVASALYRTGLFLVEREDYGSSLPCFEVALGIRRERFGWEDPMVGDVIYMEGLVRASMRDNDRALLLLYDALRIRRIHGDSPNAAATLRTIGDMHVSKGEYDLADAFYEESLQEASACHDDSIPDVLLSLAKVKKRLGMKREALECFEEVLREWHDRLGPNDPRSITVTASLSYEIGILCFQLGEYARGEKMLRNFVWVRNQQGAGPDSPDARVARACYILGNHAATETRDADRARNYWMEALQLYQVGLSDDHPHIVELKSSIRHASELASQRRRHAGGFLSRFNRDKSGRKVPTKIVVPDVEFECMKGMRRSSVF